MSMLTIPDEILIHLLTFVEDIDLQMLALTCKRLRSFTIDGALRRFILLKRTPARIQSSLSYRSSRDALAKRNILRGIHIRQQIQDGEYISGPIAVQSYHISRRLERQIVSMKLNKKLGVRPDWTELVERGLIPEEMFVNQDECETRHKWRLYRKQQKAMDHQDNQHSGTTHLSRHQGVPQKGPQGDSPRHTFTPSRLYSSSSEPLSCPTRPRRQRKSISMALVPTMTLLRKAMDRDRLSRLFQNRPSYTELNQTPRTAAVLQTSHLIAYKNTSPDLVPLTSQLHFLLLGRQLREWFCRRSSCSPIAGDQHTLSSEVKTAWTVCPGVSKKVQFYEGLIQEQRGLTYLQRQQKQQKYHHHHHHHHHHRRHHLQRLSVTAVS